MTPPLTLRDQGVGLIVRYRTEAHPLGPASPTRFGCAVRRKAVASSVERNRLKRWLREAFRRNRPAIPPGLDLVAVVYEGRVKWSYQELESQFLELVGRLKERRGSSGR